MDVFENVDLETKTLIVERWKIMSESDKTHFINQASLALTVWGNDLEGKGLVIEILKSMVSNGSTTLADFGLYISKIMKEKKGERAKKVKRASLIIEGYRLKHELPSEPHRDIGL